ncbi:MAG: carboxyl-terminal processing protease CtpA [Elainellaceae cyanobacterium]
MMRKLLSLSLLTLAVVGSLVISFAQPAHAFSEEHRFLSEVWRIVDRSYVDDTFNDQNWWFVRQTALKKPLDTRDQTYDAIQDMLATLDDPFTRFLRPTQYRSLQMSTSGELTGVGLQIAQDETTGVLQVIAPVVGSPADEAGIQSRDRILKIDGIPTTELSLDESAERMRGVVGSHVFLTVQHGEASPTDIDIVRDRISLNPVYTDVRSHNETNIGYIRLSQFNANATEEVSKAIDQLGQDGAEAYVLDLRNNPGGLLQAGIDIARLWLDSGTIVYTVNRYGIQDQIEALGDAMTDAPLAILVNSGTASASEILSGALQDNQRAVLIGEKTFGKGLIQSLFNLSDGSGLAVTVAKYETPDHHDIHRLGIAPDIEVASEPLRRSQVATDLDQQYEAAVEALTHSEVLASALE